MNQGMTALAAQEEEQDPVVVRAAFAAGVCLLVVSGMLPHTERWAAAGLALIVFSYWF